MVDFRPGTPTAQSNTPSGRVRHLPCADISNRDSSSDADRARSVGIGTCGSVNEVKRGRENARRSLHYDNNENALDDLTTEYVLSRKRPVSPESVATDRPSKRRRIEHELCTLESLDVKPLHTTNGTHRTPQKLSAAVISRKSGQWKVSTPSRQQAVTPCKKDGVTQLDTPSRSVTFHDSVVGGDSDDVQTPKGTPRPGRRTPRRSSTSKCDLPASPSQSAEKLTPRAQRSVRLTPKSAQKGTPGRSAEAAGSASDLTPQRSSARIASASKVSSARRGAMATPRTKDPAARRLLTASSPGIGRVLRPRTPRSYKFTPVKDEDDDLYQPDDGSSDEEEFAVKKTPSRKTTSEVQRASVAVCMNDILTVHHCLFTELLSAGTLLV